MSSSPPNTSELTAAIYRQFESRLTALKAAGPFNSSKRGEYYKRAEEIRELYRAVRKLEAEQVRRAN